MKILRKLNAGFTLIEITIVLLIVTILLGYTLSMFPVQQELKQYRQANAEMDEIVDALIAFAQVNGRLPCPSTVASANNFEDRADDIVNATGLAGTDGEFDGCDVYYGFLPSGTLGVSGNTNNFGVLQDPWGRGYGYAVTSADDGSDSVMDFVVANGIRNSGISAFDVSGPTPPDLFICDDSSATGDHADCAAAGSNPVVSNVVAVVVSLGKSNDLVASSNIQRENFDDFNNGTNDKVFVSTTRSDATGAEFDDVIKWISPNLLFSKMIEADQLP